MTIDLRKGRADHSIVAPHCDEESRVDAGHCWTVAPRVEAHLAGSAMGQEGALERHEDIAGGDAAVPVIAVLRDSPT